MPVHQEWSCSPLPLLGQNKSSRVYWGSDVWCSCKEKRELNIGNILGWQIHNSIYTDAFEGNSQKSHHHLVFVGCQWDSAYWFPFHRSRNWVSSRLRDLPVPGSPSSSPSSIILMFFLVHHRGNGRLSFAFLLVLGIVACLQCLLVIFYEIQLMHGFIKYFLTFILSHVLC